MDHVHANSDHGLCQPFTIFLIISSVVKYCSISSYLFTYSTKWSALKSFNFHIDLPLCIFSQFEAVLMLKLTKR